MLVLNKAGSCQNQKDRKTDRSLFKLNKRLNSNKLLTVVAAHRGRFSAVLTEHLCDFLDEQSKWRWPASCCELLFGSSSSLRHAELQRTREFTQKGGGGGGSFHVCSRLQPEMKPPGLISSEQADENFCDAEMWGQTKNTPPP